jgi:cytochrome c oxidase assembly factor CtaG/polyferredoxin
MSSTPDAFLRSWPFAPWLTVTSIITAAIYLRGWRSLHRHDPVRWHIGRPAAFLGGLTAIFLALASPIEPFAALLLQVHMLQHLLLMMVAPPLVWLGWPLFPLLRGLPAPIRTYWIAPLLRWPALSKTFAVLTHPFVAWPLYVGTTWIWHTPRGYELGLSQDYWHVFEHACFITSAGLFWYPVVGPYPSRPRWPRWMLFPYLLLADAQNTVLAAWLCFSPVVLYPYYTRMPRLDGLSALDDQAAAGVLMWVPGSIAFLLPLFWIGVSYLFDSNRDRKSHRAGARTRQRVAPLPLLPIISSWQPSLTARAFDLLCVPIIGRFLRWRFARPIMQLLMALLAVIVIFDGLRGPQFSPMNLAGVLPWIHWRGVLILGLLVAGNVFCMACPFTLPRTLARRWLPRGRPWPRWLRSKWLAVGLIVLFLWSYEAFALWNSPWMTAWIAIGYFIAAFAVDSFFSGAAFCKYVCPIGQFNFVQSLVSPLEVKVREPAVCASCQTKECIRGGAVAPGCALDLFQPRKHGNLDCTFCLDCVHACPHENVGVLAAIPGRTIWTDPFRSGIGRFSRRPDLAALVLVLVFGAFANAAGMIEPVVKWQDQLRLLLGKPPRVFVTTVCYFFAIVLLPLVVVSGAAAVSRFWGKLTDGWLSIATRYSFTLVPIGFGMWLAHYSFHLLTSYDTIIPATQRFAADHGWGALGAPLLRCTCCRPPSDWIPRLEILMLDVGLLLSLYTAFRIAESTTTRVSQALKAFVPWGLLIILLFACGVWIVFQPMEMRGTLPPTG